MSPEKPSKIPKSRMNKLHSIPIYALIFSSGALIPLLFSSLKNKPLQKLESHKIKSPSQSILLLSGSQPSPCPNPPADHLLLRFLKNKLDYSRRHRIHFFYNSALLHPSMPSFWAKIPLLRAAMLAHPRALWLCWIDSDALFTDMDFQIPLHKYAEHNLVVHGWNDLVYKNRSWTALNAGVFLLRNCKWSRDFLDRWAQFGPQDPGYKRSGQLLRAELPDKLFPDSDDQSALIYLMIKEKDRWADKIYLENEYYLEGYWVEIVGRLQGISEKFLEMEKKLAAPPAIRRPFITHFTGCQPCSGEHNKIYSWKDCYEGMLRALNFADDQILREYGFRHTDLLNDSVVERDFDFPVAD